MTSTGPRLESERPSPLEAILRRLRNCSGFPTLSTTISDINQVVAVTSRLFAHHKVKSFGAGPVGQDSTGAHRLTEYRDAQACFANYHSLIHVIGIQCQRSKASFRS